MINGPRRRRIGSNPTEIEASKVEKPRTQVLADDRGVAAVALTVAGFAAPPKNYKAGDDCARPPTQTEGWGGCVNEIARKDRAYAPGAS